jgi:hypothetical protein
MKRAILRKGGLKFGQTNNVGNKQTTIIHTFSASFVSRENLIMFFVANKVKKTL